MRLIHSSQPRFTGLRSSSKTASTIISPSKGRVTFALHKRIFIASTSCTAAGRIARAPTHRTNLSFTASGHALTCTDRQNNG